MQDLQIVSDPNIMMGKPVIAGTRITVEHILEQLAGGRTISVNEIAVYERDAIVLIAQVARRL